MLVGIKIDPKTGEMKLGWQIVTPPFDWDLGDAGKKVSDGWMFWTCYNSERATGKLEVTASQRDRDYIAAVDWKAVEKAVAEGKGDMIGGVKVIDPRKVPGLVYLLPCGKSPHGVDVSPDGKYIVGSGKLQGVTTVFNFEKIQTAIRNKNFTGDEDGIPVLKYEDIKDAEVPVGLGPLHTQFGPDGFAYTSLFVDSAIAKWKMGTWEVVDKIPMSYSIGHLCAAEGDTCSPKGKYLVGLNKLSHGRHLSVGPSQPESSQLVDISEEKMKLLYDAFTEPEPHYAQMISAKTLHPIEVYPKEENKNPLAIWDVKDAGVTRKGNDVLAKVVLVRSTITPTAIEVEQGDTVKVALTNIEQTTDELHGFGLLDYNINIVCDPGRDQDRHVQGRQARRVPLLLHQLLLGAPPGDAGLPHRQAQEGITPTRPARAAARRRPGPSAEENHMKAFFERSTRFLGEPLHPGPRLLLLLAFLLLIPTYLLPLWKMTMFAPQYPEGLRLEIYSYKLEGGNGGQDVKEINILNHYIGMRDLTTRRLHGVQVDPVRRRHARPALPAGPRARKDERPDRRHRSCISTSASSRSGPSASSSTPTATAWRRRHRSRCLRSCLPSSATRSWRTSRSTPTPPRAPTPWPRSPWFSSSPSCSRGARR